MKLYLKVLSIALFVCTPLLISAEDVLCGCSEATHNGHVEYGYTGDGDCCNPKTSTLKDIYIDDEEGNPVYQNTEIIFLPNTIANLCYGCI